MKKINKKIIAVCSVIFLIFIVIFGVFCSGSSIFSDAFKNQPETQSEILELQYKITKKDKVLKNLCNSLQMVSNGNQSNEHLEKLVSYSEMYLKNDDVFDCSLYGQYIMALSKLSEHEALKVESKNFLVKCSSEKDFQILYISLLAIKEEGSQKDKDYVKTFAKEIIDGSYLNANSEEKYKELESKYMNLAE